MPPFQFYRQAVMGTPFPNYPKVGSVVEEIPGHDLKSYCQFMAKCRGHSKEIPSWENNIKCEYRCPGHLPGSCQPCRGRVEAWKVETPMAAWFVTESEVCQCPLDGPSSGTKYQVEPLIGGIFVTEAAVVQRSQRAKDLDASYFGVHKTPPLKVDESLFVAAQRELLMQGHSVVLDGNPGREMPFNNWYSHRGLGGTNFEWRRNYGILLLNGIDISITVCQPIGSRGGSYVKQWATGSTPNSTFSLENYNNAQGHNEGGGDSIGSLSLQHQVMERMLGLCQDYTKAPTPVPTDNATGKAIHELQLLTQGLTKVMGAQQLTNQRLLALVEKQQRTIDGWEKRDKQTQATVERLFKREQFNSQFMEGMQMQLNQIEEGRERRYQTVLASLKEKDQQHQDSLALSTKPAGTPSYQDSTHKENIDQFKKEAREKRERDEPSYTTPDEAKRSRGMAVQAATPSNGNESRNQDGRQARGSTTLSTGRNQGTWLFHQGEETPTTDSARKRWYLGARTMHPSALNPPGFAPSPDKNATSPTQYGFSPGGDHLYDSDIETFQSPPMSDGDASNAEGRFSLVFSIGLTPSPPRRDEEQHN